RFLGAPTTVDNDIPQTHYFIRLASAVRVVAAALDRLHPTASAHHRVLVTEVMGRDAGWVAVAGGLPGGADFILIPEAPVDLDAVCNHLYRRHEQGKDFSIIVLSEGVVLALVAPKEASRKVDDFGH